jgi:hypothetical protein
MSSDVLPVSGDIYASVVRQGFGGIDQGAFRRLVRVQIAGRRHPGWVQLPGATAQHNVTEMASYRQPA